MNRTYIWRGTVFQYHLTTIEYPEVYIWALGYLSAFVLNIIPLIIHVRCVMTFTTSLLGGETSPTPSTSSVPHSTGVSLGGPVGSTSTGIHVGSRVHTGQTRPAQPIASPIRHPLSPVTHPLSPNSGSVSSSNGQSLPMSLDVGIARQHSE